MRIEIYTKSKTLPTLIKGPAMHSTQMFRTIEHSKGCKPYMLVGYDTQDNELGHLLVIKRRTIRIIPPILNYWYTINGEGAYRSGCSTTQREEIFAALLEKTFDILDFRHTFIEVLNIEDSRFAYSTLSSHNFIPMRDQRLYISLHSKEPQERLTRAYKAHIRKAEKSGVTYRRATTPEELMADIELVLKLCPGAKKLNLHACYAIFDEENGGWVDRDQLEPKHFKKWMDFCKERKIGCDFNPTFFSHPKCDPLTLSSPNEETRKFWVEHGKACVRISQHIAEELGMPCVMNIWTGDGFKDIPADRIGPRIRYIIPSTLLVNN